MIATGISGFCNVENYAFAVIRQPITAAAIVKT
jgi:hypothetical protein